MKRTFTIICAALAAIAMFAGLVHLALVAAHVSEPATASVSGLTPRGLWGTTVAALALLGVLVGGQALRRSAGSIDTDVGRSRAILALVLGLIAAVNGGLNLAVATGGPGPGNGGVGDAAALVLRVT